MGGITNGALLTVADGQFDALLTVDQGIEYQQTLSGLRISIVVMRAPSNDVDDLRPLVLEVVTGSCKDTTWRNHASGWLASRWTRIR